MMEENMPQSTVAMNVRRISPAVSIIDIEGAVTHFAEQALMGAYNKAVSPSTHTIILNFGGLEYLCSGIGPLIMLLIRARHQQQHLLACGLSEHYRDIFSLTGLCEVIHMYQNEHEALTALN
jgi:anti-sigma B factor antagonist